jgi:hypothetical protein
MSIKFNCTDVTGKQIEVATPLIDKLTAIVADATTPEIDREKAFTILKYVRQRQAESNGLPELDRAAHQGVINIRISSLWDGDDYLVSVNHNGVERLEIVTPEPEVTLPPAKPLQAPVKQPEPQSAEAHEPDEPQVLSGPDKLKAAKDWAKTL